MRPAVGDPGSDRFSSKQSLSLVAIVTISLGAVYLRWTPLVPDLAAQVARSNVIRDGGIASWWTGWFGGLSLPNYSVLVPAGMAILGVRVVGLMAVGVGAVATTILARDALRPRAGAVAFAVSGVADLLAGRVTFTAGLALAAWALIAVRSRRTGLTVVLAASAYLASPLAGLFLGLILLSVAVVDRSRRRSSAVGAFSLLLVGGSMAVFFPGTGTMPFRWEDAIAPALGCAAVVVLCPNKVVRAAGSTVLLAMPLFMIVPGAVGANITRLAWVGAVPIVIACAPLSRRLLIPVAALLAIWPVGGLAGQLRAAATPSAQAAYYAPLRAALAVEQHQAGPIGVGQRVEVVDTENHWGSAYLSTISLARGWDRQADNAYNPIFYDAGALTSSSYQHWLDSLAVGWVALPVAPLDYASLDEGRLIRSGLDYLQLTWSNPQWHLYRVIDSQPLVRGAQVQSVGNGGVVLKTAGAATVVTRIRWSPYLIVRDPASDASVSACVIDADGWVDVVIPRAATVRLSSRFDATARLTATGGAC